VAVDENIYPLNIGMPIQPKMPDGRSVDDYMQENNIGGLMVLKDDKIRLEAYGEEVDSTTIWTSFSVGKSITSMLLGVALKENDVASLHDPLAKYIPELKGKDYGKVSVKELLTMTSGIEWNEDYADPQSDVAQMYLQPCQN